MRLKTWVSLALVVLSTSLFAQTEQHKMSPEEQKAM